MEDAVDAFEGAVEGGRVTEVPLNELGLGAQVLRDRPLGMGEGIEVVEHAHALGAREQGVD